MKALKGVMLFGISLGVTACFDPPEFPLTPEIDFEGIYFKESKTVGVQDSLVLTLSFRDGDGDLGLSGSEIAHIDPPYHDVNYFLATETDTTLVKKETRYLELPQFVQVPSNATGLLVNARIARDPKYAALKLPQYIDEISSCLEYSYTYVFVDESDKDVFDPTLHNVDTVLSPATLPKIYILQDTFYIKRNPNYANIEVEYLVKEGGGYEVFDWQKEYCEISFNQRFPVLSDKEGPLEGSLQYAMVSSGMKSIFSIKTMKLRFRIRDRKLNNSDWVETPEFTLDKIKR
jgi:hypothetical protein